MLHGMADPSQNDDNVIAGSDQHILLRSGDFGQDSQVLCLFRRAVFDFRPQYAHRIATENEINAILPVQ